MDSFKNWLEQTEFVEFVHNVFEGDAIVSEQPIAAGQFERKPWSAKKKEVIQIWKNLMPNMPIIMQPMSGIKKSDGGTSSFGEDGIRISGSWQFIAGVLSRLKQMVNYENEDGRLRLVFKGIENARPDRNNYVFYVNLQSRTKKKDI